MSAYSTRAILVVLTLFACLTQLVMGAAVPAKAVDKRDVFVPPVLYPHAGTVWAQGQTHNVTWNTSNAPEQITNRQGFILLRKGDLATPVVLGNGFDILLGRIEVTLPKSLLSGDDYSLVLFGDSGNFSPQFTINGISL
ncbi:hypothetical protein OH76DRAFT_1418291 [Lentinus brumalis]|uniref:Yeast cell wall synthesis Kre9/Knh1-like N-terminal domain-containing protein n=1 Tax=Lentinus brumalis TaxID=2498619 RepID=A0A371DBA6_9APHY|nr:hypothetical protein OH76DRAFT_1418291 [Polyporus brumalis]